jgi:hypothetical protein
MGLFGSTVMQSLCLRLLLALAGPLLVLALLAPLPAAAQGDIEPDVFYEELDRHGQWREHPRYGEVWLPDVEPGWRPYSIGRWVLTDEHGWYWESDEPFGWIVYHYGRWHLDDSGRWAWVPGTEWGPAWVAWRHGDEDIGWAPLPPEVTWYEPDRASVTFYDAPRFSAAWCFVPVALFTAHRVWTHLAPRHRNHHFVSRTRFEPTYRRIDGRVWNGGIDPRRIQRFTGRVVPTRRIELADRPGRTSPSRDVVRIYRPRIAGVPPAPIIRLPSRPDGGWRRDGDRRDRPDWRDRPDRRPGDGSRDRDGDRVGRPIVPAPQRPIALPPGVRPGGEPPRVTPPQKPVAVPPTVRPGIEPPKRTAPPPVAAPPPQRPLTPPPPPRPVASPPPQRPVATPPPQRPVSAPPPAPVRTAPPPSPPPRVAPPAERRGPPPDRKGPPGKKDGDGDRPLR